MVLSRSACMCALLLPILSWLPEYYLLTGTQKHSFASLTLLWAPFPSCKNLCHIFVFIPRATKIIQEGKREAGYLGTFLRIVALGTLGMLIFSYTGCDICIEQVRKKLCGKWSLFLFSSSFKDITCQPVFT